MPADTALVGRDVERDRLRAALADAAGGAPQALVIRGDPGVGKTRLLDAAVADAAVAVPGGFRLIRVAGRTPIPPIDVIRTIPLPDTPERP